MLDATRAPLCRIREPTGDKRVVALIKAFLCAGVLSEDSVTRGTKMATRTQRGTRHLSPRALADDFVVMVAGPEAHAEDLAGRGSSSAHADGTTPVGTQDSDRSHRRGVRVPGVPHPAGNSSGARTGDFPAVWRRSQKPDSL